MKPQEGSGIKIENIVQAGAAIKSAVSTVLLMILLVFICVLIGFTSTDLQLIKVNYIVLGIILLFCNLRILIKFFVAGDKLENVQLEKQDENNYEENTPATLNLVKYSTDKGILEIPPCISFKGQKAFLNREPAPDGKYKYGFMSYFHIKDGIIIKG